MENPYSQVIDDEVPIDGLWALIADGFLLARDLAAHANQGNEVAFVTEVHH